MNYGTKLGTSNEELSFSELEKIDNNSLQGTKLGSISELEKELLQNEETPEINPVQNSHIAETEIVSEETKTIENKPEIKKSEPIIENLSITNSNSETKSNINDKTTTKTATKTNTQHQDELEKNLNNIIFDYNIGDLTTGIVRAIEKSGILVDFKYKADGFIPNNEFSLGADDLQIKDIKPGDEINVLIIKLETKEGYALLSRKKAEFEAAWNYLIAIAKTKEVINVDVISKVEGGLVVDYKGIRGFIPASQVIKKTEENLDEFLNTSLDVTVIQVERKRRKVIFSHKLAKQKSTKKENEKLYEELEVGQIRTGLVSSIRSFGVFVDLGGAEGLVHISELSWARVNHPSELLKIGDEVKVFVLGFDKDNRKISLGMKQLQADPWVNITEKYEIGQIVQGKVSRLVSFGAFIQLDKNIEGLIHISELSYDHIDKIENVIKPGDTINAKIIKLIPEEQKIGLSLKGIDQTQIETNDEITK